VNRIGLGWIALALAGCGGGRPPAGAPDPRVTADLARLRETIRPYQNLDAAVSAGYPREVKDCIVHEHHGAMGYHHVNRSHLERNISVERPQILLYERLSDGGYRLNGVEFIIPFRFWPRDTIAPEFLGQTMKRETNLNYWYLHVWTGKNNPDGIFADFDPEVRCPEGSRTIYRPSPP
jgi:hypothetical protein